MMKPILTLIILIISVMHGACKSEIIKKLETSESKTKSEQPNLVFIFSDQQAFDMLGCYGNTQIKTPRLDQFATEGLMFTHCFSNEPICTPFRGMLMSGQHSLYNGCYTNDRPLVPGNGKKFAEVLRDAGYSTAYVGKWHLLGGNRNRPIPKGEMRYGFDELFLTNNCHVDFRAGHCFFWNDKNEKVFFDDWEVYGQTSQALKYLDMQKDNEEPFALFVSWHPPHDWGKFKGEDGEMHYKYDAPEELMAMYDRESLEMRPGLENTPDRRRMLHGHMAQTTGVDIAFGRIMDKLEELDLDENTLVVFTSDHGDMLEFYDAEKPKQYPQDYSCHIPFIIRWPGIIQKGTTTKLLFGAMDMMPTILGLMELNVPSECQGKNLADAVLSNNEQAVEFLPIWLYPGNGYRGVITHDYTFATQKDAAAATNRNVLYDRKNDPHQLNNLFGDETKKEVQEQLWQLTQQWMSQYNDQFWQGSDFSKAATANEWNSAPYIRPVDVLK